MVDLKFSRIMSCVAQVFMIVDKPFNVTENQRWPQYDW